MGLDEMYSYLIDNNYFTEEELRLITNINGYSKETLEDCIYSRYGLRSIEDLIERQE